MKNYFQFPLLAIAVVIVLFVVSDSLAQSYNRGGSSSRGGSAARNFPAKGSTSTGSGSKSSLGRLPSRGGIPSRGSTSKRSQGSSSRSPQGSASYQIPEDAEPLSQEAKTAIEELNVIRKKLVDNRKRIDRLFREMPVGFADAQMEKQKQIDIAKEQTKVLKRQLTEQGMKIFRLAPMREKTSVGIVLKKLNESLAPTTPESTFAPKMAMEISKLILEQEGIPWQLLMKTFKASYAVQDFEQASLILDRLEEFGPVKDVYYEVLEKTSQAWQDELIIRRLETATGDLPYAVVETTEGKFIIELFENQATSTVYDFVTRAESGFYDGLSFHWVRPGEFSRVGWSRETRRPANDTISSEAQKEKARKHFAGSVSMVSADGQTTSSVFQICHQPNLEFNGNHTVFGRIVDFKESNDAEASSEDALELVYRLKTIDANRFNTDLTDASRITKVTIKNKRSHDYKSNASTASAESKATSTSPITQAGGLGEEASSFDLLPQGEN